jgi:hypothetical protein
VRYVVPNASSLRSHARDCWDHLTRAATLSAAVRRGIHIVEFGHSAVAYAASPFRAFARATACELRPGAISSPPTSCLCTSFTPSSCVALLLLVRSRRAPDRHSGTRTRGESGRAAACFPRNPGPPTDHHRDAYQAESGAIRGRSGRVLFRGERVRPGDLGCGRARCRPGLGARSRRSLPGGSGRAAASAFLGARAAVRRWGGVCWARGLRMFACGWRGASRRCG